MPPPAFNFLLSHVNLIDLPSTTLTASGEYATLPAAFLRDPNINRAWRCPSPSGFVRASFGALRPVRVLGVFGVPYLSPDDTIRWRLGTSADAGDVFDSGAVACGRLPYYARSLLCLPAETMASHLRVDIEAASRDPAPGWFDVGRLWAGPAWQGERNFAFGIERDIDIGLSRQTPSEGAPATSVFVDPKERGQTVSFALPGMTGAEIWDRLFALKIEAGGDSQVLFVPNPVGGNVNRDSYLGLIRKADPATQMKFDVHSTALTIAGGLLRS